MTGDLALAAELLGAFLAGMVVALLGALWLARRELRRKLGPLADTLSQTAASSGSVTMLGGPPE